MNWSQWHERLHKKLLSNEKLIPKGASILIAVSGGQDSMALLRLALDLNRLHKWKIHVWHGDHGWHNNSGEISRELQNWCQKQNVEFSSDKAKILQIKNEETARKWRYESLLKKAKEITSINQCFPCLHILTAHTSSDRAETFLMNLARGSNIAGLASLNESRLLDDKIHLIRPLLGFSRAETKKICIEMKLPIWLDPSNNNLDLTRNKIRKEVLPLLNKLYKGCELRIAVLSERLHHFKEEQRSLASLALSAIKQKNKRSISRSQLNNLHFSAKQTILNTWLKDEGVPSISAIQLEEISLKVSKSKPPGQKDLPSRWQINWCKEFITLSQQNK